MKLWCSFVVSMYKFSIIWSLGIHEGVDMKFRCSFVETMYINLNYMFLGFPGIRFACFVAKICRLVGCATFVVR